MFLVSPSARNRLLSATVLCALLTFHSSAIAQEPPHKASSDESGKKDKSPDLWTAVIAGLVGLFAGIVSAQFSAYIRTREGQIEQWQLVRTKYLAPFASSAEQVRGFIAVILGKLPDLGAPKRESTNELIGWFRWVKDFAEGREPRDQFYGHCNGTLYFAVASLYITATYFAIAARIRANQPYIATSDFNDRDLMKKIDKVRDEFSGDKDGLWDTLQDSIGVVVTHADGSIMDYREFCSHLVDEKQHVWFLRLMDFYIQMGNEELAPNGMRIIDNMREKLQRIDHALEEAEEYVNLLCTRRIPFFGRGWIHA